MLVFGLDKEWFFSLLLTYGLGLVRFCVICVGFSGEFKSLGYIDFCFGILNRRIGCFLLEVFCFYRIFG